MGKLNLLHHKSYHPYRADNVEKVRQDEEKQRLIEEEGDRRSLLADSEARVDRLRKKSSSKKRGDGIEEGERELQDQLNRTSANAVASTSNGSRIIRPDPPRTQTVDNDRGHINFWAEFEAGTKTTSINPAVALEKQIEKEKLSDLTKMYISKRGEGIEKGWYADAEMKSMKERKEGVEGGLERAYKDGEHKRLADPLAVMQSYLSHREAVRSGSTVSSAASTPLHNYRHRERYIVPTSRDTERGDFSPVITSLIDRHRPRSSFPPAATSSSLPTSESATSSRSGGLTVEQEAISRVSLEKSRAAALIASRRPASSSMGTSSITPSESGSNSGMYNSAATREARQSWVGIKGRRDQRERRW